MKKTFITTLAVIVALGAFTSVNNAHARTNSGDSATHATTIKADEKMQNKKVESSTAKLSPAVINSSLAYKQTLRPGYQGDSVIELQRKLQSLGYYGLTIDGKYGPGTRAAVARFQKAKGLSADGVAGANTFAAFNGNTGFTLPPVKDDKIEPSVCTLEYAPVCGQQTINCITEPCDQPDPQTFSNKCKLRTSGAKYLYEGKCDLDKPTVSIDAELSDTQKKKLIEKLEAEIERLKKYIEEVEAKIERIEESL